MKTKKCRPILIETNEKNSLLWSYKGRRLYYNQANFNDLDETIYYQLILISLEDEKIEVGDSYYNELNCTVNTYKSYHNKHNYNSKKVIATQDKISPEYIDKFVEQYNSWEVEDIEIEMEDKFESVNKGLEGFPEDDIDWWVSKPKLTNRFINIVEEEPIGKPLEDYIREKHSQDRCMGFIDGYKSRKSEESILHTPEEILNLLEFINDRLPDLYSRFNPETELKEWFEQNKKK